MTLPPTKLDDNSKFLVACAINLYLESRRRIDGRVLLGIPDVDPLLGICEELITARPLLSAPQARPDEPSEEEQEAMLNVQEQVLERMERRA